MAKNPSLNNQPQIVLEGAIVATFAFSSCLIYLSIYMEGAIGRS